MKVIEAIGGFVSTAIGIAIVGAILLTLLLGTIGPAWEGTKRDRNNFWLIFLPCFGFLVALSFWIGKVFG